MAQVEAQYTPGTLTHAGGGSITVNGEISVPPGATGTTSVQNLPICKGCLAPKGEVTGI